MSGRIFLIFALKIPIQILLPFQKALCITALFSRNAPKFFFVTRVCFWDQWMQCICQSLMCCVCHAERQVQAEPTACSILKNIYEIVTKIIIDKLHASEFTSLSSHLSTCHWVHQLTFTFTIGLPRLYYFHRERL